MIQVWRKFGCVRGQRMWQVCLFIALYLNFMISSDRLICRWSSLDDSNRHILRVGIRVWFVVIFWNSSLAPIAAIVHYRQESIL